MALDDKQKKRLIALAREFEKKKGFTLNQKGVNKGIKVYKDAQQELLKLKEENKDQPQVVQEIDKNHKKLQNIIDDLNEYMRVLHPEGLLDMGTGSSGKSIVGQG